MIFNIKMYDPEKQYAVVRSVGYESVLRHSHQFIEMVYVESGTAVQKINFETIELKAGDLFVIADDSEHNMRPTCEENDFRVTNIIWCKEFIDFDYSVFTPVTPVNVSAYPEMIGWIHKALSAYEERGTYSDGVVKGCLYFLLSTLAMIREGSLGGKKERNRNADYVAQAVRYISDNFSGKINLSDVAGHVGLSNGYLQKLFKKERQTSVIEYLLRYRVEQGCKLLIETDKTIAEISDGIGFSDIKNFHYTFKRVTGMTPNEYRRTHKMKITEK